MSENSDDNGRKNNKERKEAVVEPFSVPTSGAFYMHDNRSTIGGRRSLESKDDNKWGHDKFEELTITTERRLVEHRRGSRGRDREISSNVSKKTENDAPMSVKGRGPRRYRQSHKPSRASSVSSNKPVYNAAAGPTKKTSCL